MLIICQFVPGFVPYDVSFELENILNNFVHGLKDYQHSRTKCLKNVFAGTGANNGEIDHITPMFSFFDTEYIIKLSIPYIKFSLQ